MVEGTDGRSRRWIDPDLKRGDVRVGRRTLRNRNDWPWSRYPCVFRLTRCRRTCRSVRGLLHHASAGFGRSVLRLRGRWASSEATLAAAALRCVALVSCESEEQAVSHASLRNHSRFGHGTLDAPRSVTSIRSRRCSTTRRLLRGHRRSAPSATVPQQWRLNRA